MRTLILGANGQLGRDLMAVFGALDETAGFDLPELDIADAAAIERVVRDAQPELVINAAAYTDVEAAETDEAGAFAANETGARNTARAAAAAGAPILYFSTDYVFGGAKDTPYTEDDVLAPIGVYARSKAAGEAATREENPRYFILRTAWLYGPGGNCFPEKILRAAAARPALKVVDDEIGSPTHTWDLAEAACAITGTEAYGAYHAVNGGACSRYEFALRILELSGADTPVAPCASSDFEAKAERPLYSVLATEKLQAACGYAFRPWDEALAHYMQRRKTA